MRFGHFWNQKFTYLVHFPMRSYTWTLKYMKLVRSNIVGFVLIFLIIQRLKNKEAFVFIASVTQMIAQLFQGVLTARTLFLTCSLFWDECDELVFIHLKLIPQMQCIGQHKVSAVFRFPVWMLISRIESYIKSCMLWGIILKEKFCYTQWTLIAKTAGDLLSAAIIWPLQ